ncbi:MAG: hypothetical protein RLZ55_83 [Actinomycetota bacterium]
MRASRKAPPLERKIDRMLIVGFRGLTLEATNAIYRDIRQYRIGGTNLFDKDAKLKTHGRNITSPAQVQALTASLIPPPVPWSSASPPADR